MNKAWFKVVSTFRRQKKNWSNLNEEEREIWREAYREQFGKEYKPRRIADRWAYDAEHLSFDIIRKEDYDS